MRRVASESREPGMRLARSDDVRPELSDQARTAGEVRRRERAEIKEADRQIKNLEGLFNKLKRRLLR